MNARRPDWLGMNTLAALIVAVGFGVSLLHVWRTQEAVYPDDEVVVRIGHFQLEAGYRDAMQRVIDDYNRIQRERGHRVRVTQMAVNSRVYGQWLNTQMYAGNPPDLIQNRIASTTHNPSFVARFVLPISDVVTSPNPYNVGTDLEDVPWKQTFTDNMRGAYHWALQDQYGVSTTVFTNRLFFNKALLRRAYGLPADAVLPSIESMEQLLALCERIRELPPVNGRRVSAIAADAGTLEDLYRTIAPAFMASFRGMIDVDKDGESSYREKYLAVLNHEIDLHDPRIRSFFEVLRELSTHFPPGYLGLDREQSMRRFRNGRAAMLITESASSATLFGAEAIARQRGELFELGAMRLPQFDPDGRWSGQVWPYGNEINTTGNVDFMVFKQSRAITAEKNWPLDFLMYLTSREVNERFCQEVFWMPVIRGAEPLEQLEPMMPDLSGGKGVTVLPMWPSGGQIYHYLLGRLKAYARGEVTVDELLDGLEMQAFSDGQFGMRYAIRASVERSVRQDRGIDRTLAAMSTPATLAGRPPGRKYLRILAEQVTQNAGENERFFFERRLSEPLNP